MDPSSRPSPAIAGLPLALHSEIEVIIADPAWRRFVARPEAVARQAAHATGGAATIVLASDAEVKRLNARHRDRNKPTNVLTFEPAAPGLPGEIVLALGTVRREAQAAQRRPADHLAHLVVHGMLHLQGHDHGEAGEARRMEMAESRALSRLRRPNPWKTSMGKSGGRGL
jgi:probable rRNA maturation factor